MDSVASEVEGDNDLHHHGPGGDHPSRRERWFAGLPAILVTAIIFWIFTGAGIGVGIMIYQSQNNAIQEEALALAVETGQFFSDELDKAILPLFSMAQFAVHLGVFQKLPDLIGLVGQPGALPLSEVTWKRNVTGVCDDPQLVSTFVDIANTIKRQSGMQGILTNIQLAPYGVICLLHPMNNTEDFEDGKFMDNTPAWGLDLFHDPAMEYIATKSIKSENVGVAGPLQLKQCPTCDPSFIARLPIIDNKHSIIVDGVAYPRWGFATALIAWTALVNKSGIYETFADNGYEFQLTRRDRIFDNATQKYNESLVVLAETPKFHERHKYRKVSTSLETTNNEWFMTVSYNDDQIDQTIGLVIGSCVVVAFLISYLIYTVLSQKHEHAEMQALNSAQEARVATERDMTAYFAHELRNPLSALDSALNSINVQDIPASSRELLDSMQLCSSFMSSIMNNLLDARKIEEGKMRIRSRPVSLTKLIDDTHKMMKSSVRPGVKFTVIKEIPKGRNWVLGDVHRIQQVLTNVLTNAIKYTLQGSITLIASWEDELVQLECIDTGPGIPKSEQDRMFNRFVQRGGAPGTGLGLNIAQQIVTMMQGTIGFESDPTIAPGTTCRILLPLELCEQPEEPAPRPNLPIIEEPVRVLIIDDIKMNRTMLSRRIQKSIAPNAIIAMAETGEQAIEMCESMEFDIIICDQFMEEAGGVMVGTDAIIAMRRNKVKSFIIGCSGNDLDADFYDAGADLVWRKPMPTNDEIIGQWRDGLLARQIEKSVRLG